MRKKIFGSFFKGAANIFSLRPSPYEITEHFTLEKLGEVSWNFISMFRKIFSEILIFCAQKIVNVILIGRVVMFVNSFCERFEKLM